MTLTLLFGGISIGLFLGTVLAIARYRGSLSFGGISVVGMITSVVRGTPLILHLSLVYFSVPVIFGIKLSVLSAGVITFGLNSAAYVSEIVRSGIQSLPKGQFEAAKTLQIPTFYMWRDIILPQVLRNILPSVLNEVIALLKETALVSTIGGLDITRRAQVVAAEQFTYFMPLCVAGACYYAMVLAIEQLGRLIERRVCVGS